MTKYNSKNERIKHEYCRYLAEADGKSMATIDGMRKALLRYEQYTQFKNFSTFNRNQAIAFKKHLEQIKAERSRHSLSKSTILSTLNYLKGFFKWLAQQPGYKSKIHLPDISYLNLSDKDTRAAKALKIKKFPTLEQIHRVIFSMPDHDDIAKRNRALIAFAILTGIRVEAMISLKLKHVDLENELVTQDPREVKTKFSKAINTYFFPVGEDIRQVFVDWFIYLQKGKLYGYDDPIFPKTLLEQDANYCLTATGLKPESWTSTNPVREIFRNAFEAVGLPYYNPHSFRHTLGNLMKKCCQSVEEMQAWSLNLGHESLGITLDNYGYMNPHQQGEMIRAMGQIRS